METIKEFYQSTYPQDNLGEDINPKATFERLQNDLSCLYDYIGVYDSLVRERIFEELTNRTNTNYNIIYDKWLNS